MYAGACIPFELLHDNRGLDLPARTQTDSFLRHEVVKAMGLLRKSSFDFGLLPAMDASELMHLPVLPLSAVF